jgi:hypothetical protein
VKTRWNAPWALLTAANVLFFCVLGFYQSSSAEPREGNVPFPIPEEQRGEMINLLTDVRELLKEQNALLRSGNLRVVVAAPKKR